MKLPYPAIEIAHLRKDLHSIRDPLICSALLLFASTLRKVAAAAAAAAADCAHLYAQVGVEAVAYSPHPLCSMHHVHKGSREPRHDEPKNPADAVKLLIRVVDICWLHGCPDAGR